MTKQKYDMPALTYRSHDEVIDECQDIIYRYQQHEYGFYKKDFLIAKIALAALTAEKFGYVHNVSELSEGKVFKEENRHYGRAVYTAPPVPVLKLPIESTASDSPEWYRADNATSWSNGFNAAINQIKDMNGMKE